MKKYLKLRKHTFKKIDKFFLPRMDKPVFDKGLVLLDKINYISVFRKHVCQMPGGRPGVC